MAFDDLKARQAVAWGSAPFERIAHTLADMHDALIDGLAPAAAERWLDVACGTGELLMRGAGRGAQQVGVDLAPALVETARRQSAERGLPIDFHVGDVEELPFADGSFDLVSSSVGAIFAPDHRRVAAELARVCRPGGRVGLTAWIAEGEVGVFFDVIGRYAPPPPPGAGNPMQWGDRGYVEELLGDAFDLDVEVRNTPWQAPSPDEMWDEFSTSFGPIKTLLAALDEPTRAAFRSEMLDFFASARDGDTVSLDRPYVLIRGERRGAP